MFCLKNVKLIPYGRYSLKTIKWKIFVEVVVKIQILRPCGLVDLMVYEVEGKETCTDYPLTMKMMNRLLGTETLHNRCSSADILILISFPNAYGFDY